MATITPAIAPSTGAETFTGPSYTAGGVPWHNPPAAALTTSDEKAGKARGARFIPVAFVLLALLAHAPALTGWFLSDDAMISFIIPDGAARLEPL